MESAVWVLNMNGDTDRGDGEGAQVYANSKACEAPQPTQCYITSCCSCCMEGLCTPSPPNLEDGDRCKGVGACCKALYSLRV